MNDSKQTRLDLIAALIQISSIYPEWRMGQTMANLAAIAGKLDAGAVWDLEDEEAIAAARTLLKEHAERHQSVVA